MKKKATLFILLAILLASFFLVTKPAISGRVIQTNSYSYTTAICNSTKYCEDYVINCDGKTPIKITPTGFSVQHSYNWTDHRKDNNLCN